MTLYFNAVRSGKKRLPELPEWVNVIQLAEMMNVMPSVIDDEPLEWIERMQEYYYHKFHQPKRLNS